MRNNHTCNSLNVFAQGTGGTSKVSNVAVDSRGRESYVEDISALVPSSLPLVQLKSWDNWFFFSFYFFFFEDLLLITCVCVGDVHCECQCLRQTEEGIRNRAQVLLAAVTINNELILL